MSAKASLVTGYRLHMDVTGKSCNFFCGDPSDILQIGRNTVEPQLVNAQIQLGVVLSGAKPK